MKQVLQNLRTGDLKVEDVPAPAFRAGGILVKNHFSLVSAGTEKTSVDSGRKSLLQKARSRPEDVKRLLNEIRQTGFLAAYRKVMSKLNSYKSMGYSSAGVVIAVDPLVSDFTVGDRVACAGAGYANHADIVFVPKNLAVKVPDSVGLDEAAYATIGSIALQGIRQAEPSLGESFVVIGLGLVGLLAVQILKANGCSVFGIDIDPQNVELAKKLGADNGAIRTADVKSMIHSFTAGYGADGVIIAAATKSSDPLSLAGEITRDRSRIVMIGETGMNVPRAPYYMKELELKLSRSYGPGRYDPSFEEQGNDYPIGYVRWTENRNMREFIKLVGEKKVDVRGLTTHKFHIEEGEKAYALISGKSAEKYIGILLQYDQETGRSSASHPKAISSSGARPESAPFRARPLNVGFIGAGSFAQSNLLPALAGISNVSLQTVCTSSGVTAKSAQNQFGFSGITTNADDIISDTNIGTVFIATRHNLHASLALRSLKSGKNVFVEKPLALNEDELISIAEFYRAHDEKDLPLLMVGFNRRFAPLTAAVKSHFKDVGEPIVVNCRINAGFVPKTHWTQDPVEGGGRIVGEVCHFVDLIQFITDSRISKIMAESVASGNKGIVDNDNASITLRMKNGSLGIITYLANGDMSLPKERIEVTAGKRAAVIDNFQVAYLFSKGSRKKIGNGKTDKGITSEVKAFMRAVQSSGLPLISFDDLINSSLTTFRILTALSIGMPVEL